MLGRRRKARPRPQGRCSAPRLAVAAGAAQSFLGPFRSLAGGEAPLLGGSGVCPEPFRSLAGGGRGCPEPRGTLPAVAGTSSSLPEPFRSLPAVATAVRSPPEHFRSIAGGCQGWPEPSRAFPCPEPVRRPSISAGHRCPAMSSASAGFLRPAFRLTFATS